uniref:Uncharacterized protein n=1 Tax=Timema douglasi TaxID=61478 RepID=A0A7R8VHT0_TIMDO|nr:unnamed protein product [Timema douglasi]
MLNLTLQFIASSPSKQSCLLSSLSSYDSPVKSLFNCHLIVLNDMAVPFNIEDDIQEDYRLIQEFIICIQRLMENIILGQRRNRRVDPTVQNPVELNTTSALANYATEAGEQVEKLLRWLALMATDPNVPDSIPGASKVSVKQRVWKRRQIRLVRTNVKLLE